MENELPQQSGSSGRNWGTGTLVVILAILTTLILIRAGSASFIDLDDGIYIEANPHVVTGLTPENIGWAFTTTHAGYWIPLTWLSLQLDATLTGVPAAAADKSAPVATSPLIYHVDNLFEHVCAAVVLFLFLNRATKARWPSFVVALIWAIHPLRVESVAWVTERKDVLSGIFGFLSLYLYAIWAESGRSKWFNMMCISFALSIMAKPLFVTLPFILLLLDVWPLNRFRGMSDFPARLREKWIPFVIMFAGAVIAFFAQRSVHAVLAFNDVGIAPRLENSLLSYVRYLWMQVSVGKLGIFYPYLGRAAGWKIGVAIVSLLALTIFAWVQRVRRPWILIGWLWYLGTLVPMIGFVQTGEQAFADRFTYLPSVGLLIAVIFCLPAEWFVSNRTKMWIWSAVALVVIALAGFTIRQLEFWQDSIQLDQQTLAVTQSNYVVQSAMGAANMRRGRPDLALVCYEESIRINPNYVTSRIGLGAIFLTVRRPDLAAEQFSHAVAVDPENPEAHNLFGIALASVGRLDDAISEFSAAAQLDPSDPRIRGNLAHANADRARPPSASAPASTTTRPG